MASPSLHILEVGHGNCSIVLDTEGVIVIDGGPGEHLSRRLERLHIQTIHSVLVSHAHEDHLGGLIGLLMQPDICIKRIYLNSNAFERTKVWQDFRSALAYARRAYCTEVHVELTSALSGAVRHGILEVQVLAPSPELAAAGPGGTDLKGRKIGTNRMSAVIRILKNGTPVALLAGDLDGVGLEDLAQDHPTPSAEILVFPHHGGIPGATSPTAFTQKLCEMVRPRLVVFSIGRENALTPQPEVMDAILDSLDDVHIMCTQLSKRCWGQTRSSRRSRRLNRGSESADSCAGTIVVDLSGDSVAISPGPGEHARFVARCVPGAICRR